MTPARWRSAALTALTIQVAGLFAVVAYALWRGNFSEGAWFTAVEAFLSGLVLAWWTAVLRRFLRGWSVAPGDGALRALSVAFPWLTSFRLVLWFLTLLSVVNGAAPDANTVALTALMTVWPASILAGNAVYGTLARLAPNPADLVRRRRLADWLNVAAALSLAMAVFNVVPIAGFSDRPTPGDQLVYGLSGALDVLATLLAMRAVGAAPVGEGR
ncbi:hypothetical protein DAETH_29760 [Deinococcus aetherius]|uniref:Uncharacterized protein n=1 Tax=Deinococcus aetherius TaxID=200252 RepID=A0ABN6RI06_9DEIO|nr:hypothetical protein [Deinococcus aetherius]BDP43007.1 hypothetical protein DAETH_29760 [Deinococcus aetherius]